MTRETAYHAAWVQKHKDRAREITMLGTRRWRLRNAFIAVLKRNGITFSDRPASAEASASKSERKQVERLA